MSSARPKSSTGYQREGTSALIWVISAMIAAFLVQLVLSSRWLQAGEALHRTIGLTIPGLAAGRFWTLLTHAFLHRPGFIFHAIGNIFILYFLGRELLPMLGSRRFFGTCALATVAGALAWIAVHWRFGGGDLLIGATAAVCALIIVHACFFPQRELNFLLFFIVPVSLRLKHVALSLVGFDLLGLLFYEIPGTVLPFNLAIAHSAHLGGMAVGYLYFRYVHDAPWFSGHADPVEFEVRRGSRPMARPEAPPPALPVGAPPPRTDIRVEVDRILDKINSHGLAALTAEEKRVLDGAKDSITRR